MVQPLLISKLEFTPKHILQKKIIFAFIVTLKAIADKHIVLYRMLEYNILMKNYTT
jgi:hypothetical protein